MTRDELIDQLGDDLRAAIATNVTLTGSSLTLALNTVIGTVATVDPTKKPTIKHITDVEFV